MGLKWRPFALDLSDTEVATFWQTRERARLKLRTWHGGTSRLVKFSGVISRLVKFSGVISRLVKFGGVISRLVKLGGVTSCR